MVFLRVICGMARFWDILVKFQKGVRQNYWFGGFAAAKTSTSIRPLVLFRHSSVIYFAFHFQIFQLTHLCSCANGCPINPDTPTPTKSPDPCKLKLSENRLKLTNVISADD